MEKEEKKIIKMDLVAFTVIAAATVVTIGTIITAGISIYKHLL